MMTTNSDSDSLTFATRTLFVTPNGNRWALYGPGELSPLLSGSLDSDPLANLLTLTAASMSVCDFKEKESSLGFVRYHLTFSNFNAGKEVTCRLTIAD